MNATYYRTDEGYIAVTNESPAGFKGVVLIGRDAAGDRVFPVVNLRKLPQVALADVPPEWVEKLGYDEPVTPEPPEELILLDEEGENLVAFVPVSRPRRRAAEPVEPEVLFAGMTARDIGMLLGLLAFFLGFWFFCGK